MTIFSSLQSRFPNPLSVDFLLREAAGQCAVEFCGIEREYRDSRVRHESYRIIAFFDQQDKQIAVIYSNREFYVDKPEFGQFGQRVSPEELFDFMLTDYPDIAEYLLWNQ